MNLAPCATSHTSTSLCPSQGWTHSACIGAGSAKPQHKQLQIKRWRQSWHWAPTLPNPVSDNQVSVPARAQTQRAPPPLRDTPLPSSPPFTALLPRATLCCPCWPRGQSPALTAPAPECQRWGSKGCAGAQGALSPSGLEPAPGGQHPPRPPQGRWVPAPRCCAGRPWGGSHTSPSSASASGSGA